MPRRASGGVRGGSIEKFLGVTALVVALAGGMAASSSADSPYTVNVRLSAHKAIEFDADGPFDTPCLVANTNVTEVFNEPVHILAAGIDGQGNFVEPVRIEDARAESLSIVPTDPTLPTYTGHSTAHTTNLDTSPYAVSTNTIRLRGTDGSHLLSHENIHVLVKASGITLFVDTFTSKRTAASGTRHRCGSGPRPSAATTATSRTSSRPARSKTPRLAANTGAVGWARALTSESDLPTFERWLRAVSEARRSHETTTRGAIRSRIGVRNGFSGGGGPGRTSPSLSGLTASVGCALSGDERGRRVEVWGVSSHRRDG